MIHPRLAAPLSGEEPGKEVHCCDGHAHAEEDACKNSFRATFPESKRQTRYNNRDQRKSARDGAGERLLKDIDGVLPWRISGLRESRGREKQSCGEHDQRWNIAACDFESKVLAPEQFHFRVSPSFDFGYSCIGEFSPRLR